MESERYWEIDDLQDFLHKLEDRLLGHEQCVFKKCCEKYKKKKSRHCKKCPRK